MCFLVRHAVHTTTYYSSGVLEYRTYTYVPYDNRRTKGITAIWDRDDREKNSPVVVARLQFCTAVRTDV